MDDATIATLGVLLAISAIAAVAGRSIYSRGCWPWWRPTEAEVNHRITVWSYFFAIVLWPIFAVIALTQRAFAAIKRQKP